MESFHYLPAMPLIDVQSFMSRFHDNDATPDTPNIFIVPSRLI